MASINETILRVLGDESDAERGLKKLSAEMEAFERQEATATLDLNDASATRKLDEIRADLARFARETATADADVNTAGARANLDELRAALARIDHERATPEVNAKIAKAQADLAALQVELDRIDHEKVTVDVDVRRGLSGKALTLERDIAGISREAEQGAQSLETLGGAAGGAGGSMGSASGGASSFGGSMKVVVGAVVALIPVVGALVGALGALIGSLASAAAAAGALAVALGAAMGPALGVIGATALRATSILKASSSATTQQGEASASSAKSLSLLDREQGKTAKSSKEVTAAHQREYKASIQVRDARQGLIAATRQYAQAVRAAWKEIREAAQNLLTTERLAAKAAKAAQNEVKRSIRELAEARTDAAREEREATRASVQAARDVSDANRAVADSAREVRDAYIEVREAERGVRDSRLAQTESELGLLDAEDALQGHQETTQELLESIGLSGEALQAVLSELSTADLSTLDIGALLTGAGVSATPAQIEKVSDAARELQEAQLSVAKATNSLSDATEGLGDADRKLSDAHEGVTVAAEHQTRANEELAEAQQRANEFVEKGLKAYEPYVEALKGVADAQRAVAKAEGEAHRIALKGQHEVLVAGKELAQLRKDGVKDNAQVISAAEGLRDAHQRLAQAIHESGQAMKGAGAAAGGGGGGGGGYGGALSSLGKALTDGSKLEENFASATHKVKEALADAFRPATGKVLEGLTEGMEAIIPLLGELKPLLTGVGEVIGEMAASAGEALAGPAWSKALKYFAKSSQSVTKSLGESFGALAEILRNIAIASMPFLISGLKKLRDFLQDIANSTDATGELRDDIGGLVGHLKAWLNLAGSLGGLMIALLGGATAAAGKSMVETIAEGADKLAAWAESAKGQKAIKQFFEETLPLVSELGKLLGGLILAALQFTQAMAPLETVVLKGANKLVGALNLLLGLFNKLGGGSLLVFYSNIFNLVSGMGKLELAIEAAKSAMNNLGGVFGTVADAIASAAGSVISVAVDIADGVIGAITGSFGDAVSAGKGLVEQVKNGINSVFSDTVGAAQDIMNAVLGKITGRFANALSAGENLFEKVKGGINDARSAVVGAAGDVVSAVIDKVTGAFAQAFNAASNLFEKVKGGINDARSAVVGVAGDVISAATGKISDAWDAARNKGEVLFQKVGGGISAVAGDVKDAAKGVVEGAISAVKAFADAFKSAGESLMSSFASGVKAAAEKAIEAAKDAVSKIKDILPGSEPKDPTSPLRGLPKAGEALISNFAAGIRAAAPDLSRTLSAGLTAMVSVPEMRAPALVGAGSTSVTNHYDLKVQSPAGAIADPGLALARLETEIRARGGLG